MSTSVLNSNLYILHNFHSTSPILLDIIEFAFTESLTFRDVIFQISIVEVDQKKVKVLLAPMAHRVAPISVSVALGHASANAVKATNGAGPLVAPHV